LALAAEADVLAQVVDLLALVEHRADVAAQERVSAPPQPVVGAQDAPVLDQRFGERVLLRLCL